MYWCYSGLIFGRCVVQVVAETPADCQVFHGFPHFVQTGTICVILAFPSDPSQFTICPTQLTLCSVRYQEHIRLPQSSI